MGNFYANIALGTSDIDAVVSAVTALDRRAYVARDGGRTYVFDEKCDEQDLDELERLATALSKELACAALAACNHDDDVLVLLLAEGGALSDRYDSNPGYFDGAASAPSGGDAERLCHAFGASDKIGDVEELLRRRSDDVGLELGRHIALCEFLGLSERMALQGYRYLSRGELAEELGPTLLRLVTPSAERRRRRRDNPHGLGDADPSLLAAMQAEGDLFWNSYALALHDATVPERFVPLFGIGNGNGHLLHTRLREYVVSHNLVKGGWLNADNLLTEFLGERQFVHVALARLLRSALGIPPLGDDQIAAFNRGDPDLLQRIMQAVDAAMQDAESRGVSRSPPDNGGEDDEA